MVLIEVAIVLIWVVNIRVVRKVWVVVVVVEKL